MKLESLVVAALAAPLFLLAGAREASSDDEVLLDSTFPTRPGKTLRVELETGARVEVRGARTDEVRVVWVRGEQDDGTARVSAVETEEGVHVTSSYEDPEGSHRTSLKLSVTVPDRYEVEVDLPGGAIQVQAIDGSVTCATGGGSMTMKHVEGAIDARTGGGSIELADCTTRASLRTGAGSIDLQRVKGSVSATTSAGSIEVSDSTLTGRVSTSAGKIVLDNVSGDLSTDVGVGKVVRTGRKVSVR